MPPSLRPKPYRGDVIAAGVVVLATLVWVLEWRFRPEWPTGVHVAYAAAAWAFVTALAVLAPIEGAVPRAYQSVLYVASVTLAPAVLVPVADLLGAHPPIGASATVAWVFGAISALALLFAVRRNSAVCTLLGAITGGVAVLAVVSWVFSPSGPAAYRWVLLLLVVVFGLLAVAARDRRLRHGVALVDAAGLGVLALAMTFTGNLIVGALPGVGGGVSWGWELVIVAAGFGLIAYSSVDRQPGPAYLGVASLGTFTVMTSGGHATLIGWPLVLALGAAVLLVVGLRPTTPAPPPPDGSSAPAVPLR